MIRKQQSKSVPDLENLRFSTWDRPSYMLTEHAFADSAKTHPKKQEVQKKLITKTPDKCRFSSYFHVAKKHLSGASNFKCPTSKTEGFRLRMLENCNVQFKLLTLSLVINIRLRDTIPTGSISSWSNCRSTLQIPHTQFSRIRIL